MRKGESDQNTLLQSTSEQDADPRVDLAVERTVLALERTQLAWIRTTLTLIATGIALDKGLEALHNARLQRGDAFSESAHAIGTTLAVASTILFFLITWYFINRSGNLSRMNGKRPSWLSPTTLASFLVLLLGVIISYLLIAS